MTMSTKVQMPSLVSTMLTRRREELNVGSVMTMSTKVQMPSLINTMLICQQEELNVVEGSACNCSHPTWKLASRAIAAKVLRIAS